MTQVIQGKLSGGGRRVAIAVARFNELVSGRLLSGALDALGRHGVRDEDVTVVWVPGSFELPLACGWLARSGKFDAVIALGAVIRGETSHYDHVCSQAARGILDAATSTSVPVIFGVLTCEDTDQALARAGGKSGNKGADCALAALEMISVKGSISTG